MRKFALSAALGLTFCVCGGMQQPAASTVAASAPAAEAAIASQTAPAATTAATDATAADVRTMSFRFEDTPMEDILREVTVRLGIVIEKEGAVPGRVSVMVPDPVNADQAADLLNSLLLAVRYSSVEVVRDGEARRILRVMPFEQAKKASAVVSE